MVPIMSMARLNITGAFALSTALIVVTLLQASGMLRRLVASTGIDELFGI